MLLGSVSRIPYASSVFRGKSLSSGNVSPSFSLHAAIVIGKSELMPTTWAFRLSNLGRSSWKAATSRVQVGVNAPMNPKSTMFFLPTRSLSDNFSCVVAGSVKSGALSPTCRAVTGAVAPRARSVASATTAARMPVCLMSESPPDVRVSLLHQRLHEVDGLLSVPLPWTDCPSDHGALPVDDQRDRYPADPVLPGDGHPRVQKRRQAVTVLLHEWLDVLLAAAVERHEVDDHVQREHRLEGFEALEFARAGGAPGRPEAQDGDLAGKLRGTHDPPRQVGKRERRSRGPLRKDEDRRVLPGAECDTGHENHRSENDCRSQHGASSLAGRIVAAVSWAVKSRPARRQPLEGRPLRAGPGVVEVPVASFCLPRPIAPFSGPRLHRMSSRSLASALGGLPKPPWPPKDIEGRWSTMDATRVARCARESAERGCLSSNSRPACWVSSRLTSPCGLDRRSVARVRSRGGRRQDTGDLLRWRAPLQREGEAFVVVHSLPHPKRRGRFLEVGKPMAPPEFLLVDSMAAFHLAVLLGTPRPDVAMANPAASTASTKSSNSRPLSSMRVCERGRRHRRPVRVIPSRVCPDAKEGPTCLTIDAASGVMMWSSAWTWQAPSTRSSC